MYVEKQGEVGSQTNYPVLDNLEESYVGFRTRFEEQ
jgi:hypothetical protein